MTAVPVGTYRSPPMRGRPTRVMTFVEFCERVLELQLTPAQRVLSLAAFDRFDPIDLATEEERSMARVLFGDVDRIPSAARESQMAVYRLGRRSGKTMLVCAARGVYRCCTADLSECGPGDIPAAIIVAPTGETAKIAMAVARELVMKPLIRKYLTSSSSKGFTIRRPQDGREVQFIIRAKGRGGVSFRGYSLLEAFLDEAEFVTPGVNARNDADLIDGGLPALTVGAMMNLVSTPYPAPSEMQRLFEENFGKPKTALAMRASTPVMRNNDPMLMKKIEAQLAKDERHARQEYFCELIDGAGGAFFEGSSIAAAVKLEVEPARKAKASFGCDPAFVNDSSALAGVERRGDARAPYLDVVHLEIRTPTRDRPLVPSEVIRDFAATVRAHGAKSMATDQHKYSIVASNAATVGVQTWQGPRFEETAIYLREVLREGKLRLGIEDREMRRKLEAQLRSITYRPKSGGGIHVEAPRSLEDGHADLVAALAMSVFYDYQQYGPLIRSESGGGPSGGAAAPRTPRTFGLG